MIISADVFNTMVVSWMIIAVVLFPFLIRIKAPYGRHSSLKWGPVLSNRLGWFIMELPTLLLFTTLFLSGNVIKTAVTWLIFSCWAIHYTYRIFIFPLRTRTKDKTIPLTIVIMAALFNLVNGFMNGYWLGFVSGVYDLSLLTNIRFIAGLVLFISGFIINQAADNYLINLRSEGKKGYFIPKGKLFKSISCPNFAGEMVEWIGFALMAWCMPALSFVVWTAANLIPRALHHHKWYSDTFADYPPDRKAIIPGVL
jgi:hypothetical protein